jgi:hypothetical protein
VQRDETDVPAKQEKTGKNARIFEKNVYQTGKKGHQQAQGKRKETTGFILIWGIPVFIFKSRVMSGMPYHVKPSAVL